MGHVETRQSHQRIDDSPLLFIAYNLIIGIEYLSPEGKQKIIKDQKNYMVK